jgi:hypothetical protein
MNQIKKQGIVILLFFPLFSFSCDICGNYMGLTPYDNKNIVSFLHRYRVYNGYRNYQTQGHFFPTGAYKVNHNSLSDSLRKEYSSKDFESFKIFELRLKYFVAKRMELNVFLPIMNNKSLSNGVFFSNTGLGDMSLFAGYHLIRPNNEKKIKHKLILNLGIKLPTGNDRVHDSNINRLPFEMQSGSGSFDGLLGINYLWMKKKLGVNTSANLKWNGKNKFNEQLAISTTNFVSVFYKIPIKKFSLYPTLILNYEFTKGLYTHKILDNVTAINSLLIGPGFEMYYKQVSFNASCQLTVRENRFENQLKNTGRLTLGINYNFESKQRAKN